MFGFNNKEYDTIEEMNDGVFDDFLSSDGAAEKAADIVDWFTNNSQLSTDERITYVLKRVMGGVPLAIAIIKGLGFMGVFAWLPIFW